MRFKRILDVLMASAVLLVTLPVLGLCALGVALTLGRPVLFIQQRTGFDEKPFALLKLRTMRPPATGESELGSEAGRLPPFGRLLRTTSLDELPSLLNVLRGEMSLVGPRPLPVAYLDRYSAEQRRRHLVRPGITGWAQVNGRNALSWDEKFDLDLFYVAHRSFVFDLKILGLTLRQLLRLSDVTHGDHAAMPEFLGTDPDNLSSPR